MNILIATEKLVLEKLDLLELIERRTTTSDHSDTCTADDSIQHCSPASPPGPLASYSRGRDDSRDSGKRREDITAGVSRRKRTQSAEEDFTMPCDSSQLDTSSVNTSKRLCTSKYFSSPEDCNDVDISFS